MRSRLALAFRLTLALLWLAQGCHQPLPLSEASKRPASASPCDGAAPLDAAMATVPGIRGSWFPDPAGAVRLYVLEAGPRDVERPPLVLFHGVGPAGSGDFSGVLAALSRSRRVVAVDLPGFGHSQAAGDEFGPARLIAAVDAVVRACAPGPIDVLGHSSGGALAFLFAAQRAEVVRRVVSVDPAGILLPDVLLRAQLHQELGALRERAPGAGKVVAGLGRAVIQLFAAILPSAESVSDSGLLGDSASVRAATALLDFNFGPALAGTRAPTLIVWGADDQVMPARIGHLLDDRVARSDLVFIPKAGHLPMDDQPQRFVELVSGYLDRAAPLERERDAPNRSTRQGACKSQEGVTLQGDYAKIAIAHCKRVWLDHVRAAQIEVRDSQVRLDHTSASEGLWAEDAQLELTGGELRGAVALALSDSDVDLAGVVIRGTEAAIRVRKKSKLALSVTTLESPITARIAHETRELEDGEEL